ncbi:hypothetical protein ACFQ1I_33275 [Kitasatospora arboriphila]
MSTPTTTLRRRALDAYLPPSRDGRIFATTVVIHSAGTGLYLAAAPCSSSGASASARHR